jgi:hypothetical protein
MMTYLKDAIVRASAIEYMCRTLGQGKTLASLILRNVNLQEGTITVLIPDLYKSIEISEFNRGHLIASNGRQQRVKVGQISGIALSKVNVGDELVEFVSNLLGSPNSFCILENSLAAVGDPWLERAASRLATSDREVYHFLTSTDHDVVSVHAAVRESRHLPMSWGAVGQVPTKLSSASGRRIVLTTDEVKEFAESVRCVFASAYDGEDYLIWRWPTFAQLGNSNSENRPDKTGPA